MNCIYTYGYEIARNQRFRQFQYAETVFKSAVKFVREYKSGFLMVDLQVYAECIRKLSLKYAIALEYYLFALLL